MVGFVLAKIRYPTTAEFTYAAVRPERRGAGVGTRLARRALADLAGDGVALVEVKTLDASAGYEPYEATRAFWERRGFRQIDCIDPLPGWQPGNPAAIYVAAVWSTTARDFPDWSISQLRWTRTRPAVRLTLIAKVPPVVVPVERQAPSRFSSPCEPKLLSAGPSTLISTAADFGR